jgi:hypothetical protein
VKLTAALRRSLDLRPEERWLLGWAALWLIGVDVSLRLMGFRRLVARAHASAQSPTLSISAEDLRRGRMYARWIESAARHHVIRARCLHCSLVLHAWLRREGLPCELRIGVTRSDGELKAHAWVEMDGYVVNDRRASVSAFVPLSTLDGRPPDWAGVAGRSWSTI